MRNLYSVLTCAAFISAVAAHGLANDMVKSPLAERPGVAEEIDEIFNDERFANAFWGVLVQSADTGDIIYERNADNNFIPASNQKAPTTLAALNFLGPEFRFETTLAVTGPIRQGAVEGDLVVFGNGDPTLYERFFDDSRDVFRGWAAMLKEKGVTQINGNIVGDDNAWDSNHVGFGWPYRGLESWFYAEYGPLNLNENYVDVRIHPPDSVDGEVRLVPNLPSAYYTLVNNIEVVAEGSNSVSISRDVRSNDIVYTGRVVAGSNSFERSTTITNPTAFYVTVLKETLEAEGITVTGEALDCDDIPGWDHSPSDFLVLDRHQSPPFPEILSGLYKRSQNMYAEVMMHTIGWKDSGYGTRQSGTAVINREMEKLGVSTDQFTYRDGSGLSRFNFITPRAMVQMYSAMIDHPNFEIWWDIQPIGGIDGTLRNRHRGTPMEGNVRAKTGTLTGVRALSGYVTTAGGELVLFSTIANAHSRSAGQADEVVDAMLLLIASHGGDDE
ncbi:MAG: D-alanyl-D-alanine carboxypeptidase/D-alanyl-D-alanine-endopeptidase [Candidatus Sumerlaeia bacterium]|nr:D-alanyl-D-alanine carboxypeptidase/D-alanyl-D-alanine-endopeptidase [Candidatus Sumerlaeia bacterium]